MNNIDELDMRILSLLTRDPDASYEKMGKQLGTSGSTIHSRARRLRKNGIICGRRMEIDVAAMGYSVHAFIGILLQPNVLYLEVVRKMEKISLVTRVLVVTGKYHLIIETCCADQPSLRALLHQLQHITGVDRTETMLSLKEEFKRSLFDSL